MALNVLVVATVSLLLLVPITSQAALIEADLALPGDKLLTQDTVSGLEWLDLTETLDQSFNDIQADFGGFITAGFRFATEIEVRALYLSVGIADLSNTVPASSANFPGANLLLQLMGCTGLPVACAGNAPFFQGLIEQDIDPARAGQTVMVLDLTAETARGGVPCCLGSKDDHSIAVGSYLVRPIGIAVPNFECVGFQSPMDEGPVTVKKNRVLPFKAVIQDESGNPIIDLDIVSPPVIQVLFDSPIEASVDVTDDALPAGKGTDGNQFEFGTDKWQFNLKTKNYTAEGTYTVLMVSGNDSEYTIDPTCVGTFVIE
jgi:hypothetical protein